VIEGLALAVLWGSCFKRSRRLGAFLSFFGLALTVFVLRKGETDKFHLIFATVAVCLFWFSQSIRIALSSVRTLIVLFGGLAIALYFFQGLFSFSLNQGVTGQWNGLDLNPGSIESLQNSRELAFELYMDHRPSLEERYFRVGGLSETNDGLAYRVGARSPLNLSQFPKTKNWADQHLEQNNLNKDVEVIQAWWKRSFLYSLNPGAMQTRAPLDTFLFQKKSGFCEHYAAALSTLLKIEGFDARVAVGFVGGTYHPLARKLTYEMSDAHAWVEVYDPNAKAWSRLDPTLWISPEAENLKIDTKPFKQSAVVVFLFLILLFFASRKKEVDESLFLAIERIEKKLKLSGQGMTLKERVLRLVEFQPEKNQTLISIIDFYQTLYFSENPDPRLKKNLMQMMKRI
jgi:hypothetical protein